MTESDFTAVIRALAPVVRECVTNAIGELTPRLAVLELRLEDVNVVDGLRERLVTLETKHALLPPPRDGAPGLVGPPGPAGRDGTLDQIRVAFDGERTISLCFKDGTPLEGGVITLPVQIYRGVYTEGKQYHRGDVTTWGGQSYHCQKDTTVKPEEFSRDWQLAVKRGRDGKDGRDAGTVPVITVGKRG